MMGYHIGRNGKHIISPNWYYLDYYKIDISNVSLDMNNKSLNFKFIIVNMSRTLNIRKIDNVIGTSIIVKTVKNSILYLLDFFVEVQSTTRQKNQCDKYFIEMPIVFKKGSPRKSSQTNTIYETCLKFEVSQYRPKVGSEKKQERRLMNRPKIGSEKIQIQLLINRPIVIPPLMIPQVINNNQIKLPSVNEILNNFPRRQQYNFHQ